jgi:hypothetical protein
MHRYQLSVDARLRIVLAYLDTLKLPARAAGREAKVSQLATPATLASWLADMSDVAASHVLAIHVALPEASRSLAAPSLRRML